MNFLSPDDIFSGVRRKSLCNGSLLTLTGKNGANSNVATAESTPTKSSKKERRRGSFNETTSTPNNGRRSSLVSRWFKHISDAAEQYKPRSKNASQEPVDDPAIATLPHSNTKESLELTPERPPPMSATATVTTTPLAPMMPPPIVTAAAYANVSADGGVQLRNGRRESTPPSSADNLSVGAYHKQRLSHNELAAPSTSVSSVNRTMSTRSCGEANNNYSNVDVNGVTLRHTQSARQASDNDERGAAAAATGQGGSTTGGGSKRDSTSIVYSNNSNQTRTLMQSSPPLVEPTAIQISISPAHTAEPVLTPAERLRRLDASIRDGLMEKQKIICDMFRLPLEHFHEIMDIAAMPEAPKDSADIALAAYAQVQSLTEVLNDYIHVTPEQEISAVSTAVCDQCYEKQHYRQQQRPLTPLTTSSSSTSASVSVSNSTATQIAATQGSSGDTPPPLPPPNKQPAQQQTPTQTAAKKLQTPAAAVLDDANIHEDDDGYCEIDELRMPAIPPLTFAAVSSAAATNSKTKAGSSPPPLPPPAGSFKTPPPPPPPPALATAMATATPTPASPKTTASPDIKQKPENNTPELVKRQSTISADSIPEESADEVTEALGENGQEDIRQDDDSDRKAEHKNEEPQATTEEPEEDKVKTNCEQKDTKVDTDECTDGASAAVVATTDGAESDDRTPTTTTREATPSGEPIEVNEAYDSLSTLNKLNAALTMVDGSTQTLPLPLTLPLSSTTGIGTKNNATSGSTSTLCGSNRLQHASSLEPSVPCYAINSIVNALNAQISLLLPKINERDMERERLRKENQHLRELLNAMHERQRVEDKLETPVDITSSANTRTTTAANNEMNGNADATIPTVTIPATAITTTTSATSSASNEEKRPTEN